MRMVSNNGKLKIETAQILSFNKSCLVLIKFPYQSENAYKFSCRRLLSLRENRNLLKKLHFRDDRQCLTGNIPKENERFEMASLQVTEK